MAIAITVPGDPRGKGRPRFARRGSFVTTYSDAETVAYEGVIKTYARLALRGRPPLEGPCRVDICAHVAIPASWARWRREAALAGTVYPISKPDADNYGKSALDALNKLVFADDSQVVELHLFKRYSADPRLVILVEPIGEPAVERPRRGAALDQATMVIP